MARTGTPPREKTYVYRTGRPDRLRPLLFAVAALILCAGIGAVLWHEWQGTRPTAAEQAEADEIERADGGEEEIAAVTVLRPRATRHAVAGQSDPLLVLFETTGGRMVDV